ncbi:hypothetical protein ACYPKM_02065 [Pseudomonas aeruginosa]
MITLSDSAIPKGMRHVIEVVDPYDDGVTRCLGCRQWGTFDHQPAGACPTPYRTDKELLAEALEREAALKLQVESLRAELETLRSASSNT